MEMSERNKYVATMVLFQNTLTEKHGLVGFSREVVMG